MGQHGWTLWGTHERGKEGHCEVRNVLSTLRVHPTPWKVSRGAELCISCQLLKCPYWRWLLPPGAICETRKRGSKGAHVGSFRWSPLAPPTIPGTRGCWTRLGHPWVMCGAHTTALLLRAGLFVDYLCSGDCPLRPERGPYLPKRSSWPGAPESGHTHLHLKPNVIRKE